MNSAPNPLCVIALKKHRCMLCLFPGWVYISVVKGGGGWGEGEREKKEKKKKKKKKKKKDQMTKKHAEPCMVIGMLFVGVLLCLNIYGKLLAKVP